MKNAVLEIDIKKFWKNIENIKKQVGDKEIMPVIKANAYGTYLNKNLDLKSFFNCCGSASKRSY